MRKLLGLLVVMAFIFAFTIPASAGCHNCTKCEIQNIKCGTVGGDQASDSCYGFDYDTDAYPHNGYCASSTSCKLLFDICQCDDADTVFTSDTTVSFRLSIKVNGESQANNPKGVYWTNTPLAVDTFESIADACANTMHTNITGTYTYTNVDGSTSATTNSPISGTAPGVCTALKDYKLYTNSGFYTVTAPDVTPPGSHIWELNLPPMRKYRSEITAGEEVCVLVELITSASTGGICAECAPVCTCEFCIGTLCCDTAAASYCIYFPYLLNETGDWQTSFALTNISSVTAANMEATFTLTDETGATFSYTKSDFTTEILAITIADLAAEAGWTGIAEGRCWLKVVANFKLDGWSFLLNPVNTYGGATLARPCGFMSHTWPSSTP